MVCRLILILGVSFAPAAAGTASQAEATIRLAGRVCTSQGASVPGMIVECVPFDPGRDSDAFWPVGKQASDEDGRYEFRAITAREYCIRVLIAAREPTYVRSKPVAANPGDRIDIEDLVVRPGASLKGRFISADGTSAPLMGFAYMSESGTFSPFRPSEYPRSNPKGLFYVGSVLPDEDTALWAVVDANHIQLWSGISPTSSFLELHLNPREYVAMPPDWRKYSDAEAFVRLSLGTKIRERIDWTLSDLAGHLVSLSSSRFKGKVVLVNIFGSWCGGCRIEIPHLVRLQEKYGGQGLEVIGVAFEQEPVEAGKIEIRNLLQEAKVNYTILWGGPTGADNVISTVKGIDRFCGYPTTILIGCDGQVKHTEVGIKAETKERVDWWSRRLEKRVVELLKNTP